MFKQVYGVPVYHYIKEYRLEQAAVELVRSAKPITQIAQNAGYDNASKFSEAFRKRYGTTPSQYRTHANGLAKRSRKSEWSSPRPKNMLKYRAVRTNLL